MRSATRRKVGKDRAYLEWLHTLGCIICFQGIWKLSCETRGTEAAHVGARGLSQKCPDREAIPLCEFHHRTGAHSHHKLGKRFWTLHGLDRDEVIRQLNQRYEEE